MDSPPGPGPERRVVWSAGTEPTLRLTRSRPGPVRRRGLVLGAAAAVGVLAGVVITWAEVSPVGSPPDTPLWIVPGAGDRMSEVRPSSAATTPAPAASELARVKMSELTVVPLTRRRTAARSAAPAPSRDSAEDERDRADRPSAKSKPSPRPSPSPSKSHSSRSDKTEHKSDRDNKGDSKDKGDSQDSGSGSNSGKGSKSSGRSDSDDNSGPGS